MMVGGNQHKMLALFNAPWKRMDWRLPFLGERVKRVLQLALPLVRWRTDPYCPPWYCCWGGIMTAKAGPEETLRKDEDPRMDKRRADCSSDSPVSKSKPVSSSRLSFRFKVPAEDPPGESNQADGARAWELSQRSMIIVGP